MSKKLRKKANQTRVIEAPKTEVQTVNRDGWNNIITGIGTSTSRVGKTNYGYNPRLARETLVNIYTSDCIARQVVNIIVDDALRNFINAEIDLLDELKRLKAKQKLIEAATWARLFGGAALVVFADDGQDMDKPLNTDRIKKVVSLQSYDRWQITWIESDLNQDFYSENYGHPEIYTINPVRGLPFRVHRTRMHFFAGERVPNLQYWDNNRWDDSVIQSLYEPLRNFGLTMNASAEIVQDFVQTVLGINGLTDMLRTGKDQLIKDRLNILDYARSVANTVVLDAENETYTKHASSVAGLAEIIEKNQEVVSAGSRIAITRLFSSPSKGLNHSGQNDSDNWNNTVEAYRSDELQPAIDWLIDLLEVQTLWTTKPKSFEWEFPSLKVSNEHEIAQNRHLAAQTDQIYMDRGAVDPGFIFKKRYSEAGFQTDIYISEEEQAEIEHQNDINEQEAMEQSVAEVKAQLNNSSNSQSNSDSFNADEELAQRIENKILGLCDNLLDRM
jgi:hypothetical protein